MQEIGVADEVGDEAVDRLLIQVARRALLHDPAGVHDDDTVGHRQRFGLVVRDVERGHFQFALDPADLQPGAVAQAGVEVRQRLVEQQQLRAGGDGARQRHALLLSAGQFGRTAVGELAHADDVERPGDSS